MILFGKFQLSQNILGSNSPADLELIDRREIFDCGAINCFPSFLKNPELH